MPRSVLLLACCALLIAACGKGSEDAPAGEQRAAATSVTTPADDQPDAFAPVDEETRRTHAELMAQAREQNLHERPIGELVQYFGEQLLGKPYVEHMLDQADDEELVISLAGFDCVLYIEVALALAQAVRAQEYDLEAFASRVENVRYRGGERTDYCSRLHYFTDWLYDNDRRGNLRLITADLAAARPFEKRIDFMTEHREAYRQLATDDQMLACIGEVQDELKTRSLTFVPQDRIAEVYDQLEAGDILAFTTTVNGLDAAHTGIVYKYPDGRTGMIHASTTGQVRQERDLATYVRGVRIQNGLMAGRPLDRPAR
jgi:hypothetical protein